MFLKKRYIKIIDRYSTPLFPIDTEIESRGHVNDIKCVLFDVYGTLFISGSGDISVSEERAHVDEIADILKKYGINRDPIKVYNSFLEEIEKEHRAKREQGIDYPEVEIDNIWKKVLKVSKFKARLIAVEYEAAVNPVWPMPGALEIFDYLKKRRILMGIISNAQFYTELLFEAFFKKKMLKLGFKRELIFYSYKYGFAKPSDKLFYMALDWLKRKNINPDSVLYIGNDMLNDIYTASKVGFKASLFAGDKRSLRLREDNEICMKINPDIVIKALGEIKDRVKLIGFAV